MSAFLSSGKVFSFDPDGNSEATKAVVDSLSGCVDDKRDFLKRLSVFAAQPNEAELDELIKIELTNAAGDVGNIDVDRLFVCFMENVKTWCENKNYENVLQPTSAIFTSARDRVLAETASLLEVNANKLDLVFQEAALAPLREVLGSLSPVVHVGSSEKSSRVTCMKLLQAFEPWNYMFLGSELLFSIREAVLAEWGNARHNTLIVAINNRDSLKDTNHFQKVLELCQLAVLPKKRLVILTDDTIAAANGSKHYKDTFEFLSLTLETRNKFLDTEFKLQDRPISLRTFFGNFTEHLSALLVEEIIEAGPMFATGAALPEHDGLYIPRCLEASQVSKTYFKWPSDSAVIFNARQSDIVDFLLKLDGSLDRKVALKTLDDALGSMPHEPTNAPVVIGNTFALGTFECNYLATTADKASALRCRPSQVTWNHSWFVFTYHGTSASEVAKLKEFHQIVHVLEISNGELALISPSDYNSLICENIRLLRPGNAMDVEERAVIVGAEPGMGKSTLLTHLGKSTKEDYPQVWVILIGLNDHARLFAEGKHEDATGFLSAAAGITLPLDQAMFKFALEVVGNVVVMLDSYDEIAPTYNNRCLGLLSNILKTKARKVWITTRINVKSELESHLSTSALRLCKFSDDDQRLYLKRYWTEAATAAGKEVLAELDEAISRLLKMTIESARDWGDDILDVPLHVQMIAEVFEDDVTNLCDPHTLPEKLDWLQLLDLFIEKKMAVYVQDRLKIKPADTNYRVLLDNSRCCYLTNHMEAAFHFILPEDYVKELQLRNLIGDFSGFLKKIENGEEKTGFVDSTLNGSARFVHRVFAEYFVAKWFASHPSEYAEFIEKEVSFYAFCPSNAMVSLFCDLLLARGLELHTAVLSGDVDKVTALLAGGVDVNARDLAGRTPLHLTAAFGFMGNTKAGDVEILNLLIENPKTDFNVKDDLFKGTPLRYADIGQHWLMIERLLARNVHTEELPTTRKMLLKTNDADSMSIENLSELLNAVLEMSPALTLRDYVLSNDFENLFEFCLNTDPDFFESLECTILSQMLHRGNEVFANGLLAHLSLRGNSRIVRLLVNRGYGINGSHLISASIVYPPLHCAALSGHLEIVQTLVNASKGVQTGRPVEATTESHPRAMQGIGVPENIPHFELDFINRKSMGGRTALHLASKHGHSEVVSFLIANGADLAGRDDNDSTCLHLSAAANQADCLKVILEAVKDCDRLAFVDSCDLYHGTALHLAADAGFVDSVRILAGAGGITETDRFGRTPLMLAAVKGHLGVL